MKEPLIGIKLLLFLFIIISISTVNFASCNTWYSIYARDLQKGQFKSRIFQIEKMNKNVEPWTSFGVFI